MASVAKAEVAGAAAMAPVAEVTKIGCGSSSLESVEADALGADCFSCANSTDIISSC